MERTESGKPGAGATRWAAPALWLLVLLHIPALVGAAREETSVQPGRPVDFQSFHAAAQVTFEQGRSPYGIEVLLPEMERTGTRIFPFLYPPPSLLLMRPLATVSYESALTGMMILNHVLLAGFLAAFLYGVLALAHAPRGAVLAPILTLYTLHFAPLRATFEQGQWNVAVIALVAVFWWLEKRASRPALSALPLALAIALKTYPALLLGALVVRRRWGVLFWSAGMLGALAALSALLLPEGTWPDWMRDVLPGGGYGRKPEGLVSPAHAANQSLNGFTARLFLENRFFEVRAPSPLLAALVPAVLAAGVLLLSFVAMVRARCTDARRLDLGISTVLLVIYLVAPFSWQHHLVMVLPSVLLAVRGVLAPGASWAGRVVVALAALLLAAPFDPGAALHDAIPFAPFASLRLLGVSLLWLQHLAALRQRGDSLR